MARNRILVTTTILLVIMFFLPDSACYARYRLDWEARTNGTSTEWTKAVVVDQAGNVYVAGWKDVGSSNTDMLVIKYDSSGQLEWEETFGGTANGSDEAHALMLDGSGNLFVTGQVEVDTVLHTNDCITLKYDPDGTLLDHAYYNGAADGDDACNDIFVDDEGSVYVSGYTETATNELDYLAIKYDGSDLSTEVWSQNYNGPGNGEDISLGVAVDSSHNVLITGTSLGSGTEGDFATVKLASSNGAPMWNFSGEVAARYNGLGNDSDIAYDIGVDGDDNVIVTGYVNDTDHYKNYMTIKYDGTDGTQIWANPYGGSGHSDVSYSLAITGTGAVYVTGYSYTDSTDKLDCTTIRYEADGTEAWVRAYDSGGGYDDYGLKAVTDAVENVYVTGYTAQSPFPMDFLVLQYSPAGARMWTRVYDVDSGSFDMAASLCVDDARDVYVTGMSVSGATNEDSETLSFKLDRRSSDLDWDGDDDIVASFVGFGTYFYANSKWSKQAKVTADLIVTGNVDGDGDDDIVAAFQGYGTYTYAGGYWTRISSVPADELGVGDLNGDGKDDIVASFVGYGTHTYVNGSWTRINSIPADKLGVGDLNGDQKDDIVAVFAGYGTYTYMNGSWARINSVPADRIALGDLNKDGEDDIVAVFSAYGTYTYTHINDTWTQINSVPADRFAIGDLDDDGHEDIILVFDAYGTYTYSGTSLKKVNSVPADLIATGDLDKDGDHDIVAVFSGCGTYTYVNGSWKKISRVTADRICGRM